MSPAIASANSPDDYNAHEGGSIYLREKDRAELRACTRIYIAERQRVHTGPGKFLAARVFLLSRARFYFSFLHALLPSGIEEVSFSLDVFFFSREYGVVELRL